LNAEELIRSYLKHFHEGDYEDTGLIYYAEDAIFELPGNSYVGRRNIVDHFVEFHTGLKETMKPVNVLSNGNVVGVEMVSEIDFLEDKPDFNIRPVKRGDSIKIRICAIYDLRDNKISHARVYFLGEQG